MTTRPFTTIAIERRGDGVAVVALDRAAVHNAFDETMIAELTLALDAAEGDNSVRALLLRANGKNFCAGGDLDWMRRTAACGPAENLIDAQILAELMRRLNFFAKPTVAAVQGAAYGGGVGLLACCDIVIATDTAVFSLSEVRLGLIPAVISPYVIAAIGQRAARRWFLTGERFDSLEAQSCGLVHQLVPADRMPAAIDDMLARLLEGAPQAQQAAKELIRTVAGRPIDPALIQDSAERIARMRTGAEARERIAAFLAKGRPGAAR